MVSTLVDVIVGQITHFIVIVVVITAVMIELTLFKPLYVDDDVVVAVVQSAFKFKSIFF